jgi:hypothetical protein
MLRSDLCRSDPIRFWRFDGLSLQGEHLYASGTAEPASEAGGSEPSKLGVAFSFFLS